MMPKDKKDYKFRGGVLMSVLGSTFPTGSTWPNGILEIDKNKIILCDEMFKRRIEFPREEIDKIEVKKLFPIIAHGIRIYSKENNDIFYFWYWSHLLKKLVNALKDCGYKVD